MKINPGDFDQDIVVETPGYVRDAYGADTEVWLHDFSDLARVMETPGREFLKGDYQAEEKAVFKIRWRPVDSRSRVLWGGRVWRMDSATGTMRDGTRWLHCTAQGAAS